MISWARSVMLSCCSRLLISGMLLNIDEGREGVPCRPVPLVSITICFEERGVDGQSPSPSIRGTRFAVATEAL